MDNARPTRRRSYKTMMSRCVSALVCLAMAKGTQGSTVTRSWLDADSNSIDENTDSSTRWMENGPDYLFEGDMILTYKQLESNYGPDIANAERSAGHVILEDAEDDNGRSLGAIEEAQTWPGGIVYWGVIYQDEKLPIPADDTDHNEQVFDEIAASCESVAEYLELNVGLEVKRVDRNNLPENWIRVSSFSRNGCGSSVGMYSRVQSLNLGSSNCRRRGIATHEFLHALGMFHEHTNSNRDDYVVYHEDRVLANKGSNFEKRLKSIDLGVPYDYNSIMHYTSVAFAIDFEFPTLTSVDEEAFPTSSIGSKNSLQGSDIVQLQAMYHCTKIRDRGGPVPTPESGETFGARSVQELCSPGCPCAEGQGHCRNNADCVTGLTCVSDFTTYYHLIPNAKKFMDFKLANGKGISVCREDPNAPLEPMTPPPKEGTPTPPPTFPPTKESGDPWCDLGARTDEFCCSATCGTSCFDAEECDEDSPAECCPGAEQGIALFESRTCNDVSAPCIIDEAFLDPDNRAIDDFPKTQEAVDDDDDLTLFVAIGIASVGIAMLSAVGIYKRKSIAAVLTGSPTQSVKGASGDVETPQDRFDAEVEYRNVTAAYQTSSANDSPGFSPKGPSLPSPQSGFSKAWDSTFDTKSETTTKLERAMSFAMESASNRPLQRTPSSNPPTNDTSSNSKPGLMRKTSSTFGSMMSAMLRVATSEDAQTSKVPTQKKKMTKNKSSKELAQEVRRVFDSNNTPTQQPRQAAFGNTSPFTSSSQHPKPPTSFQKASSFSPTSNSNTFVPPKPSMAKAQSARPPKPTWKPAKPETSSVRPPPGMGFNAHAPLAPASRNVGGGFSQRKPAPPAPKPGMHSRGESTGSSFNDVLAKWKGDEGNQGHSRNSSGLTPTRAKAPATGSSHRRMPSGGYITAKGSASTRNPQFEGSSNSNQFGRKLLNVASSTGQRVSRSFSRTSSASDRSSGSYVEPMTSIQQRRKLFEKRGQSETVRGTTAQQQSTTENASNLYSRNNLRPTGARTGYKR